MLFGAYITYWLDLRRPVGAFTGSAMKTGKRKKQIKKKNKKNKNSKKNIVFWENIKQYIIGVVLPKNNGHVLT